MALTVDEALRRGEEAWSDDDVEGALEWAEKALELDPQALGGLDLKAHALAELGELEAAAVAFDDLIEREPQNPVHLLSAAEVRVRWAQDDRDALEEALELLDRAHALSRGDAELAPEVALLRGLALNQLGDSEGALACLDQVLEDDPDHPEARLERGFALFELNRLDEAQRALESLTRDHPDEAWAFHYLALIAERKGKDPAPAFAKARAIDPQAFPPPVHLSPEDFDAAVAEAIERLPAHARPALENAILTVEPIPGDEDVNEGLSPTILGVFHGTPVDERSPVEAAHHLTARITLFQRNLERFAHTREELIDEIRITVLHEVGHLLGLDEDELYQRGLD
ncbi:MAG: metallopeptidase family protein [Myxococcales bacterium]|nr:metallopeptidase family protein [Myxococcales bacterium]